MKSGRDSVELTEVYKNENFQCFLLNQIIIDQWFKKLSIHRDSEEGQKQLNSGKEEKGTFTNFYDISIFEYFSHSFVI